MYFCKNCSKFLDVREEISQSPNGAPLRDVYYYCKNPDCNYKIPCQNYQVFHKVYRQKAANDDRHLNQYKAQDCTLPQKSSKCPKCKRLGKNRFERKYFNNHFYINNICSKCFHNWNK